MAERDPFELDLSAALRAYAEDAPTQVRPTELAHQFATAYPHGRTALPRWGFGRTPAMAWVLLLAGLLLALVVGSLAVGAWRPDLAFVIAPSPTPTATPTPTTAASPTYPVSDAPDARICHTATLLPDGRVLMAGGWNGVDYFATAELYDPDDGTFNPTGSMAAYRICHTATLLRDGRVLMAGGSDDSSAEIYDPATGTFGPTGSMTDVRTGHTATLLPDGRVLIAGGSTRAESPSATSAEIYDPATGTFSLTGAMAIARMGHTATLLPDGRVLVTGGGNGTEGAVPTSEIVATAELYDPATGTFSPTGAMADARSGHTATRLLDGRVLVTGGGTQRVAGQRDANDPSEVVATAEIYDPATGTFSPTGAMTDARAGHTATLLLDGRVLMAGGANNAETVVTAEIYDPATGTFSPTGAMADHHFPHTATLLLDGRVLMAGASQVFNSVEIYEPATCTF